jgi:TatD DNase family protein
VTRLPALDLHAHIDPGIKPDELDVLNAAIFAVTRSIDEAVTALRRQDRMVVWGVGAHPGLAGAHQRFSLDDFAKLLDHTPFAGELGLDGKSRVPMALQRDTLRSALGVLAQRPRLVSLHSYAATEVLLDELESVRVKGVVLHWWLGDPVQTKRAISLGCFFSVNASSVRRAEVLANLPLDRVLTETDHPFGDRRSPAPRRPGRIESVERVLAEHYRIPATDMRRQVWRNLERLVRETRVSGQLPRAIRSQLAALL